MDNLDIRNEKYNKMCLSYKEKYKKPEEWKPIVYNGITTKYIISNYGRIIDINKCKPGNIHISKKHFWTTIKLDTGSFKKIGVYRLVALAFIPVPQKYLDEGYTVEELVVDHIRDGDKDNFKDNTVWNLQWLTHRENISKASNCGFRPAYPKDFRDKLDEMILDDYGNKEIYEFCEREFGYKKNEIKGQIQVRRRRLGKTLKEHHENDKAFIEKVDRLLKKGYSNDEIIYELNMPVEGRSSGRLLQYRRSLLNIPANVSKYFTNEQNEKVNELLAKNYTNQEIIDYFRFNDKPKLDLEIIKQTLNSRRCIYKKNLKNNTSSTTIERIKITE